MAGSGQHVLDIRVQDIMDITSFWAQIGTPKHLAGYDSQQRAMTAWCKSCKAGMLDSTASLKLEDIVAVRGKESKDTWMRGKIVKKISEKLVELFHLDTGRTEYADVGWICAATPPMLCDIPQQALQCSLSGVDMLEGADDWSDAVISRFSELVSTPSKTLVRKVVNQNCIILTIFTEYDGKYTSVGEILQKEGLIKYTPSSPTTLDIPVPVTRKVPSTPAKKADPIPPDSGCEKALETLVLSSPVPLIQVPAARNTPTAEKSPAQSSTSTLVGSVEEPLTKKKEFSGVTPAKLCRSANSLSAEQNLIQFSSSETINATPPPEDLQLAGKARNSRPSSLEVSEITVKNPISARGTPSLLIQQNKALKSPLTFSPVTPASDDSSGSSTSLSDNDWFDEDLLPQKSGNSETSDVLVDSPVKDQSKPKLEEVQEEKEEVAMSSSSEQFRDAVPVPRSSWNKRRAGGSNRNLSNTFAGVARGTPRWSTPRGRGGQRKSRGADFSGGGRVGRRGYRSEHEECGRSWDTPPSKGRGRGHSVTNFNDYLNKAQQQWRSQSPQPPHQFGGQPQPPRFRGQAPPPLMTSPPQPPHQFGGQLQPPRFRGQAPPLLMTSPPKPLHQSPPKPLLTNPWPDIATGPTAENYEQQLQGMSEQERTDETKWQEWKLEKDMGKILSSLGPENVGKVGEEVEKLLHGSGAEKLGKLRNGRQPLEVLLQYVMKEAVEGGTDRNLLIPAIYSMMTSSYASELFQHWQPAVKKTAARMIGETDGKETSKKQKAFCCFLSALFANLTPSSDSKIKEAIIKAVQNSLVIWSKGYFLESSHCESQGKMRVDCFGWLVESIDLTNHRAAWEEMLLELLDGPMMECVLSDSQPRYLRTAWYTEIVKIVRALCQTPKVAAAELPISPAIPPATSPVTSQIPFSVAPLGMEQKHLYQRVHQSPIPVGMEHNRLQSPISVGVGQKPMQVPMQSPIPVGMEQKYMQGPVPGRMGYSHMQGPVPVAAMEQNQFQQRPSEQKVASEHSYGVTHEVASRMASPLQSLPPNSVVLSQLSQPQYTPVPPEVTPYQSTKSEVPSAGAPDSYARVRVMLESLHMSELFPRFREAMIKDSVLDCEVQQVKECLKDAGIPLGPIVEIMHYLESAQPKKNHPLSFRQSSLPGPPGPGYASPRPTPASLSPVTPSFPVVGSQQQYFPPPLPTPQPVSSSMGYRTVPTPTPYQQVAPLPPGSGLQQAGYTNAPSVEGIGVGYTGSGNGQVTSPLTAYHMLPPPPLRSTTQHQQVPPSLYQREAAVTGPSNMGSPATGQMLQKSEPTDSSSLVERSKSELPSPLSMCSQQMQLTQPPSSPPPASTNPPPPAAAGGLTHGFGRVNCVVCGGSDHVTYNCTQRNKFFTHM